MQDSVRAPATGKAMDGARKKRPLGEVLAGLAAIAWAVASALAAEV